MNRRHRRAGILRDVDSLLILAAIGLALSALRVAWDAGDHYATASAQAQRPIYTAIAMADFPTPPTPLLIEGEDPDEAEKIEAALLAQGYFSEDIPLPLDLQDHARTASERWGVPYPLTLAVMECESQFDVDAVGTLGEIGIMQLNPGPGGKYHDALQAATGADPATPVGNIVNGCYLLGTYLTKYGDTTKALMVYNAGPDTAARQWSDGITATKYTAKVMEAMARWESVLK